ncbi:MAG: hypothetical protein ACE5OR_13975 [bacterium]
MLSEIGQSIGRETTRKEFIISVILLLLLNSLSCEENKIHSPYIDKVESVGLLKIRTDKTEYSAEDTIQIRIDNEHDSSVDIDACNLQPTFAIEKLIHDDWVETDRLIY